MKLSVNILYSALQETHPQAVLLKKGKDDNEPILQCPRFQPGTFRFSAGGIYVAAPEQLPGDLTAEGPCLLVTPELTGRRAGRNVSVIAVPDTDVVSLFNLILSVFDRFAEWDAALQELVFQNAPIEEYLKCSFPVIGNAMSVHNSSFAYLARFGEASAQDRYGQNHRADFFDPEFLLKADTHSSQSIFYAKGVIHYQEDWSHPEYFFLNLFTGNTVAGRLVVTGDRRPFAPQDSVLVAHLGKYLETALSYTVFAGSGKNLRRDSLLEYLSGKAHSDDKIMHLKTVSPFSRLKEDQRLYCLAGMCQNSDVTEQYISFRLERALPESVSVLYDSKIVVLCANQPRQTPEDFFAEIGALLEKYGVTAGCSNPFTDFFDLKYCYREAEFVLHLMKDRQDGRPLHHFRDHTLEHFLRYGCSVLPMRLICAECVRKLAEHDAAAAVSYCESLRVYLDTGRNAMESARLLDIKRNTFLARLERIMRYVDLDLEDADNRMYVQISLRLARMRPYFNAQ